jgi:hypothetical protein
MESLDGLNGKLIKVKQAYESADVKYIIEVMGEIAENKLTQDLLAKGEEAVRALGFQQGIGIIKILPDILEQQIKGIEAFNSQQIKSKLGMK